MGPSLVPSVVELDHFLQYHLFSAVLQHAFQNQKSIQPSQRYPRLPSVSSGKMLLGCFVRLVLVGCVGNEHPTFTV